MASRFDFGDQLRCHLATNRVSDGIDRLEFGDRIVIIDCHTASDPERECVLQLLLAYPAMTSAPIFFAACIAARPTLPSAPVTRTVCPRCTFAVWRTNWSPVNAMSGMAAASTWSTPSGRCVRNPVRGKAPSNRSDHGS